MERELNVEELFREFLGDWKDERGKSKYLPRVSEIVAKRGRSLSVDFVDLLLFDRELATLLVNRPKEVLPLMEKALMATISQLEPQFSQEVPRVHVRVTNVPNSVELRKLRSDDLNKLIAVEGILVRSTPVKERMIRGTFRHNDPSCMAEFVWPVDEEMGDYVELPTVCPVCEKPGQMKLIPEKSELTDWQRVILQERPEEIPAGQLPRQLAVVVEDDLVDSVRPGDRVKLVGILELQQEGSMKRGARAVFDLYMRANSIELSEKALDEVRISEEDELKLRELAQDPWIRERIISSIAPSIYGHWEIKEGIALSLFGGVPKVLPDGTRVKGDIHLLIVGDPGTAKSQMLQFAYRTAPRSVYTTGKGATAAGLTAAVVRDKNSGDYYLEAGALVLADGGVAVIDEIDKMREEDRVSIHEAMEQQTVSIAKAGIVAKLNARTTVISAGNPKFGRYIPERGVADNINLPSTILSRFDLIFILRDKPGEGDQLLASHILDMHSESSYGQPIQIDVLKKYIAFARKNVRPVLSAEARQLLLDFFVEMRKKSAESSDSPILITPRQLEALIRMTEAYARMALKQTAEREDAERAINIMRIFLEAVGIDVESGRLDIDTIMTGRPKTARDRMAKVSEIVDALAEETECAKLSEVIEEARGYGIDKAAVEKILSEMRKSGLVIEVRTECYRKV
ncbi:minichromosome maintenance protein MCM [Sulfodiicoccus acidiphilus]|uniref:DNA helicase n=3 Tax=Sulfodiicoccus acidiphilus TaxID=1670455 RepID=A0A830GZC5_9CREN|nr:minichromosome maintenance protein MCM [Sulfodiicoccus acidiphilus]GGT93600.1 minichromosome maintenance protein MCM [Sulfodiicoccus acidiphilus]